MQYRPLGPSGIEASVVGVGTWATGGWMWGGTDEKAATEAISAAIDAGITLIDTAPIYGFGRAEEIVGEVIAGRRDKVILATKCAFVWNKDEGTFIYYAHKNGVTQEPTDTQVNYSLRPESIRWEVEQSLKRLNTDYIDLLQAHYPDDKTPVSDTMATLLDLKKEGKIRAIGISNANVDHLKQYCEAGQLDADQEKYSMLDRQLDTEQLPYSDEHNVSMLAYSPLALGVLTGKITQEREFPEGDLRKKHRRFKPDNLKKINAMLDEFKPIADRNDFTIAQLVIAWTIMQRGVTHALVGARNPKHAVENAGAGRHFLGEDDVTAMNQILERHTADIE